MWGMAMTDFSSGNRRKQRQGFEIYLRTGRVYASSQADGLEAKFNPWHDPGDGRFTFAGGGLYVGPGSARSRNRQRQSFGFTKPPTRSRIAGRSLDVGETDVEKAHRSRNGLADPKNVSVYVVKRGDNLTRIAAKRKGLRVSDLALMNGMPVDSTLKIGQRLRLPTQAYLEEGRAARANFLNLAFYMDTHGGKLPPDVAHVPSIQTQIDAELERVSINGYTYKIDLLRRFRGVNGDLQLGPIAERSRSAQREAGGKDRRPTDDGGHYIAVRFNGPSDWFNHFAQDANFNRGTYKAIENGWAKELRAGHKIFVTIAPHYREQSTRPDRLTVTWYVDGERHSRELSNERTSKKNGR
jgi:LysM repeat protein